MEKRTGGKGREGSFQVKQHPTDFIGSADDNTFRTEPAYYDNSQVLSRGNFWDCLGVGWVMEREDVSDEMGGVTTGKALVFDGVEVHLYIFDQLALMIREFWRISWW